MFMVFTRRVVKIAVHREASDRFAPRSTNAEKILISGPFRSRGSAERAALAALATHTCLQAMVCTREDLGALRRGLSSFEWRDRVDEATAMLSAQEASQPV